MAQIGVAAFYKNIQNICANRASVIRIQTLSEGSFHIQMRVYLANLSFIDVYYNQKTKKTAFAQIYNQDRIFGADNTGGFWHWHPYGEAKSHQKSENEISFEEFLDQIERTTL